MYSNGKRYIQWDFFVRIFSNVLHPLVCALVDWAANLTSRNVSIIARCVTDGIMNSSGEVLLFDFIYVWQFL